MKQGHDLDLAPAGSISKNKRQRPQDQLASCDYTAGPANLRIVFKQFDR